MKRFDIHSARIVPSFGVLVLIGNDQTGAEVVAGEVLAKTRNIVITEAGRFVVKSRLRASVLPCFTHEEMQ